MHSCILNIAMGVFNINCPFLCPCIFNYIIGFFFYFFPETFLYEIILEPENKVQIGRTLFPETF